MRVLVTGGAGYIGSHTVVRLVAAGHDVIIVDDFSNSSPIVLDRIERIAQIRPQCFPVDLLDAENLSDVLRTTAPDAVIHFAGLKAVGESVEQPLRYYRHNLDSTFNLLEAMGDAGVKTLVFSSSATVYGDQRTPPFREDATHLEATNPYGQTKVMIERVLGDIARADPAWNIAVLRYFNPIGAHPSGLMGEDPRGVPNNVAPYISQVAVGRLPFLSIYGDDYATADGTGERDYIHVQDLASGHVAALAALADSPGLHTWNLGTGRATSVLQLVDAFRRVSGMPIPARVVDRRPGDIARAWADPTLAERELDWQAEHTVDDMARDAWNWQSRNPRGFAEDPSIG